MAEFEQLRTLPKNFSGTLRLFPLPNVVLFPGVVQPLHVFEPRYRELVEESLATDGLFGLVLLEPGWERDYDARPAIAPVACVAKIVSHHRMPDGRFNILVQGLRRAVIQRELSVATSFRQAEVDLLDDFYPSSGKAARPAIQRRMIELARQLFPEQAALRDELSSLMADQLSLGPLTDIFAYTLALPISVKQRLLAQWNVDRRALLLIDRLAAMAKAGFPPTGADPGFLPPFSLN